MALCSLRCLFVCALLVAILAVLYPVIFRIPEGIHPQDRGATRLFLLMITTSKKIIAAVSLLGYNEIEMMQSMTGEKNNTQAPDGMKVYNTMINDVKVRMYERSKTEEKLRPAIIYIHGGGWVYGSPEMYDDFMFKILKNMDVLIISIRYRRAPQHKFPIPLEDCQAVTSHLLKNTDEFGINPQRVALAGDSAGGNLAAALALKLRDEQGVPGVKLQLLIYPALQMFNLNTPAIIEPEHEVILTRKEMVQFWLYYTRGDLEYLPALLANNHTSPAAKRSEAGRYTRSSNLPPKFIPEGYAEADANTGDEDVWNAISDVVMNPYVCPLMAHDLSKLPKTYIVTVGFDVLRDDGFFFSKRLKESGNHVEHIHYHDTMHGSFSFEILFVGTLMKDNLIAYIKANL